jgi:anti-anti-sigma factor
MDFGITEGPLDATTHVVEPHGEIDLSNVSDLKGTFDAAMDSGARYLIVDFEELTFIDSTGIGVLLSTQRKAQARGGNVIVVCNDPSVRRVFEITGLLDVLHVTPLRREALMLAQDFTEAS